NDTVGVSATSGALGSLLHGAVSVDLGGGANILQLAEAANTSPDTVTITPSQFLGQGTQPFTVNYQSTGGTFSAISQVTGAGNETVTENGVASSAGVVSGTGTDTINVNVCPNSGYNLGVVGGQSVAEGAQDTLNLVASPDTAVIHQSVSGPDTGVLTVLFA